MAAEDAYLIAVSRCAVLTGSVGGVLDAAQAFDPMGSTVMLLHTRNHAAGSDGQTPTLKSYLVAERHLCNSARSDAARAVVVPRDPLETAGTPVTTAALEATPLVRASRAVVTSLHRDLRRGTPSNDRVEHVLINLVVQIAREQTSTLPHIEEENPLLVRVHDLIDAHHRDARFDVAHLAEALHFSRRQVYRIVGDGVAAMLSQRRVTTASELLRQNPELSIAEVARRSGFTSASQLRLHMNRRWNMTPSEYRQAAVH
ncbi:helix-turn-helix domain-containing protein [Microbacterium koreense]|uniref:Helix-turn-helix domain-containing protein n=1 Tax=Microbacterium koreense TaxID=323761 RepID=A0ABW2ZSU4_9MICO